MGNISIRKGLKISTLILYHLQVNSQPHFNDMLGNFHLQKKTQWKPNMDVLVATYGAIWSQISLRSALLNILVDPTFIL